MTKQRLEAIKISRSTGDAPSARTGDRCLAKAPALSTSDSGPASWVTMAGQAPKRRPQAMVSTTPSKEVGVGVTVEWLRALGLCPYVVVGPEGACRVECLSAMWCALLLVLVVALEVSLEAVERDARRATGLQPKSTVDTLAFFLMNRASRIAFSGVRLLLVLFSPRLASLVREVAALQRLAGGLNSAGPKRFGVINLAFLWTCVVVYQLLIFWYLGSIIASWGGPLWLMWMLFSGDWVFSFPSFPAIVLLLSTELRRLQAATRAVLPPGWEQLVAEVRDGIMDVHCSTPRCVPPAAASATTSGLAPFLRRARVVLLQTEEVLACLLAYLGGAVMLWLCCGIVLFTFCVYYILVRLRTNGEFDYIFFALVLITVLAQLAMNMAAEDLVQERHRCARVYRRLLAHPAVAQLPEAAEVLAELERPLRMRVMQLFKLGGSCITTVFSVVVSYLVIALQVTSAEGEQG